MFIATNGKLYAKVTGLSVTKVPNMHQATMWVTREECAKLIRTCTKKLKKFYVQEVQTTVVTTNRTNMTQGDRAHVYTKTLGRCQICGRRISYDEFSVDHIIPLSKGGSNDESNLQCTCKSCNAFKDDMSEAQMRERIIRMVLFQMQGNKDFWKELKRGKRSLGFRHFMSGKR